MGGRDDIAFAVILVGSIVVSALLRLCPTRFRPDSAALAGALAIIGACGVHNAVHPLVAILLSIGNLHMTPTKFRVAAQFILAFGHLARGAFWAIGFNEFFLA